MPINYQKINKESWNNRTDVHLASKFYDMDSFLAGNTSLKEIELSLLGDIKGKSILHLQCHFGQDSISLARMGADVTGVDLSDKSIQRANKLAKKTNTNCTFICCDIYDLPDHLNKKYDIIFTTYGVIGWLPNMDKWANIIQQFLKPKGKLIFVEFHPFVWMFDDDIKNIKYRYFKSDAIIETETGTYANKNADIQQNFVMWNHGMGEVINALINKGMEINSLTEYDYSPYNIFNNSVEDEPEKFRIKHLGNKMPLVFAVVATKL